MEKQTRSEGRGTEQLSVKSGICHLLEEFIELSSAASLAVTCVAPPWFPVREKVGRGRMTCDERTTSENPALCDQFDELKDLMIDAENQPNN